MARINIEDSLYTDSRFQAIERKLPRFVAKGVFVEIARCAQKYWVDGYKLIPKEIWKLNEWPVEFIEFGLVQEREDGFYLCGSDVQFKWLVAQKENGKKGGRPTEINNLTKPTAKPIEPTANPPTPTPTPTLTPKNIYIAHSSAKASEVSKLDFEGVYKKYPRKEGKSKGMAKLRTSVKTKEELLDFSRAVDNYLLHCKKNQTEVKFIKHFGTFVSEWRDWLEVETGKSSGFGAEDQWQKWKDDFLSRDN